MSLARCLSFVGGSAVLATLPRWAVDGATHYANHPRHFAAAHEHRKFSRAPVGPVRAPRRSAANLDGTFCPPSVTFHWVQETGKWVAWGAGTQPRVRPKHRGGATVPAADPLHVAPGVASQRSGEPHESLHKTRNPAGPGQQSNRLELRVCAANSARWSKAKPSGGARRRMIGR